MMKKSVCLAVLYLFSYTAIFAAEPAVIDYRELNNYLSGYVANLQKKAALERIITSSAVIAVSTVILVPSLIGLFNNSYKSDTLTIQILGATGTIISSIPLAASVYALTHPGKIERGSASYTAMPESSTAEIRDKFVFGEELLKKSASESFVTRIELGSICTAASIPVVIGNYYTAPILAAAGLFFVIPNSSETLFKKYQAEKIDLFGAQKLIP